MGFWDLDEERQKRGEVISRKRLACYRCVEDLRDGDHVRQVNMVFYHHACWHLDYAERSADDAQRGLSGYLDAETRTLRRRRLMKWSDRPAGTGWYWHSRDGFPRPIVLEVRDVGGALHVQTHMGPLSLENYGGGAWAGPIPQPEAFPDEATSHPD